MRGVASYLTVGALGALAMQLVATSAGFGLEIGARPVADPGMPLQIVDRSHKGDRLRVPALARRPELSNKSSPVLVGCDPVFSPLSAAARANVPGRCVA
jgi:hypothetical protein